MGGYYPTAIRAAGHSGAARAAALSVPLLPPLPAIPSGLIRGGKLLARTLPGLGYALLAYDALKALGPIGSIWGKATNGYLHHVSCPGVGTGLSPYNTFYLGQSNCAPYTSTYTWFNDATHFGWRNIGIGYEASFNRAPTDYGAYPGAQTQTQEIWRTAGAAVFTTPIFEFGQGHKYMPSLYPSAIPIHQAMPTPVAVPMSITSGARDEVASTPWASSHGYSTPRTEVLLEEALLQDAVERGADGTAIEVFPRQGVQVRSVAQTTPRQSTKQRKEKEKKFRTKHARIGQLVLGTVNFATEAGDFVEALYWALPEHYRKLWNSWNGHAAYSWYDKASALYEYFRYGQPSELEAEVVADAFVNVAKMQAIDMAIGKVARLGRKAPGAARLSRVDENSGANSPHAEYVERGKRWSRVKEHKAREREKRRRQREAVNRARREYKAARYGT